MPDITFSVFFSNSLFPTTRHMFWLLFLKTLIQKHREGKEGEDKQARKQICLMAKVYFTCTEKKNTIHVHPFGWNKLHVLSASEAGNYEE